MLSFRDTNRSQLNCSRSKQLYSFPKANRFINSNYISPAPYYPNKITAINTRATSFGYGNKLTLENRSNYPSPNHYDKNGYFQKDVEKKRGYSFSHYPKKGLINEIQVGRVPGPGKYNYKTDKNDFKRVSYSFRGKFEDPLDKLKSPLGPGQYTTIGDLNSQGKYFIDKYHSSGASKIGNSKRFSNYESVSPGPGKYEDSRVTGFNNSGTYFCSTYKTNKANAFSHSSRRHLADPTIAPGPGAYNSFSDFPL